MKIKHIIAGLAFSVSFIATTSADVTLGKDYTALQKPIPQLDKDKIEVLEFFAYNCIHCKNLEKDLAAKVQNLPADTYFRPVHVCGTKVIPIWHAFRRRLLRLAQNNKPIQPFFQPFLIKMSIYAIPRFSKLGQTRKGRGRKKC